MNGIFSKPCSDDNKFELRNERKYIDLHAYFAFHNFEYALMVLRKAPIWHLETLTDNNILFYQIKLLIARRMKIL